MMRPKPWSAVPISSRGVKTHERADWEEDWYDQIFDESGEAVPVTLIEAGPCYVTEIRRPKRDGYSAVQLGFGEAKPRKLSGGELGHLKRNDLPPLRFLREFRTKQVGDLKEGDKLTVELFEMDDRVDVIGVSKGKGFAAA